MSQLSPTEAFRADAGARTRLAELLNDEVMTRALLAIRDSEPATDAPVNADPIVSVRLLARRCGFHDALNVFFSLLAPLPQQPEEVGDPTWATPEP